MRHITVGKAAVGVGAVFAAWHAIWVILVATDWAGTVLNFILELHFLKIDVQLAPFNTFTALSLVAMTFCVGALLGAIFAIVWNSLTAASEAEWSVTPSTRFPRTERYQ